MAFVDDFPVGLPSSIDPANFDTRADAYYGHLPTFVAQLNALAELLAQSAAPPLSIPYVFSATTTVADPGAGFIRLNAGTQTSATALLADLVDGVGSTVTGVLDQLDDSTSTIKGYLRVTAVADPLKWLVFAVTAVASPTGYRNITIQSGVGSSASPFADNDLVTISFVPKGDKGDVGPNGPWTNILSAVTISGSPSQVTFSSIPTGYADLLFPFNLVFGTTAALTVELSADGTNFSPARALDTGGSSTRSGSLLITDYRGNAPMLTPAIRVGASAPSSPGLEVASDGTPAMARITGGISAVRFAVSASGTFSSGSFDQPRAR